MSYCGQCKEIDEKKRKCSRCNKKLAYCRIKHRGLPWNYYFEKCDECRKEGVKDDNSVSNLD